MSKLERIKQQEKALKEKKKKALAKEYEKLGRKFYKKSNVNSFESANNMIEHIPLFSKTKQPLDLPISEDDFSILQQFADELSWNETGKYWHTNDIKSLTNFVATFRTKSNVKNTADFDVNVEDFFS